MIKKKLDLVILAGGRGRRLGKITKSMPKPLVNINGIPFIQHLINFYSKYDFENIHIIAGYKGSLIKNKYHNKVFNLIKIKCYVEKKRRDTGGALFEIKNKVKNDFFVVNGDSFINVDLKPFFEKKINDNYIFLNKNKYYKENKKLINLDIDRHNNVFFSNKSLLMNSGIYYFKRKFLNKITPQIQSLENDILKKLIQKNKLKGIVTNNTLIDIGIKKNFSNVNKALLKKFKKPAVFFDRDGVINHDKKYVHKYKDFIFKKDILKILQNLKNYYLFIVTNQSGIARGYYKESDFFKLHKKLKKNFIKNNIFFNDILYCPHHPNGKIKKYKIKCLCRKPGNLMLKKIIKSWNIDIKRSYMIGDSWSDERCAKKTNIKFIYSDNNISELIKN